MTAPDRSVGVIIPAAGRGVRAGPGEPKQFRELGGVPMLLRSVRPFTSHPRVDQIVVVLPREHVERCPVWLEELKGERLRITPGGETRAESVALGLGALDVELEYILIHDAARPFVSRDLIDAVLETLIETGDGVITAIPVGDTIKRVRDHDGLRVLETVDRSELWRAQTPQGFRRGLLGESIEAARSERGTLAATDEAGLLERLGRPVRVVPGDPINIKVTTAEDLRLAEAILSR